MFFNFIHNINWVDLLLIGLGIRIIYIGIKNGFVDELFKCVGILSAIFITFHYYTPLAKLLHERIGLAESLLTVLCFGFLFAGVLLLFKLIREGITLVLKIQAHSILDRWGGFAVSLLRSLLAGSVVLISLQVSGIEYFQKNVKKSLFSLYLLDLSPDFYKAFYEGCISKFFPNEKFNPAVFQLKTEKEDSK